MKPNTEFQKQRIPTVGSYGATTQGGLSIERRRQLEIKHSKEIQDIISEKKNLNVPVEPVLDTVQELERQRQEFIQQNNINNQNNTVIDNSQTNVTNLSKPVQNPDMGPRYGDVMIQMP